MNKFFTTQEGEEKRKHVSHSQFKTWRECPRKWQHKYRDGKRPPDESIHLVFGTAIHEALQEYLQVLYSSTVNEANGLDLKTKFQSLLKEEYESRKDTFESKHPDEEFPVSKKEMVEFGKDGNAIIEYFKRNRAEYFSKQDTVLVGIEEKVERELRNGIYWIGYLDIVLRNRKTGKYKIIDLKTSTDGWDKWKKREKKRTDQLVAYKKFYAEELGVDPDAIEVEYLIMKRKLNSDAPYKPARFQRFSPSDGSRSRSRVTDKIEEFLDDCFTEDAEYRDKDFDKEPDKWKCCFCPFSKDFGEEGYQICDQNGMTYLDYPESMRPYVPNRFVGPQPEQ